MKKLIHLKPWALLIVAGVMLAPTAANAVVQSLNDQTGQTQTFSNDSNLTITSAGNVHSLVWTGILPLSRGGTGSNSFSNGSVLFSNGTSISQDNTNLFWNNVTKALTVGGNLSVGGTISGSNLSGTNTGDQNLSILVPYTGATTNVDLGTKNLTVANIKGSGFNAELRIDSANAANPNTDASSLFISSGLGNGTGNGGGIEVLGGRGGVTGNGGGIRLVAGYGGSTSGNGGGLNFQAGDATGSNSNGGDVSFQAGKKSGSGTAGSYLFYDNNRNKYGSLDFSTLTLDRVYTFPNNTGTLSVVTSGSGAPSSIPVAIGQIYIDISGAKVYCSTGTSSSADWVILN